MVHELDPEREGDEVPPSPALIFQPSCENDEVRSGVLVALLDRLLSMKASGASSSDLHSQTSRLGSLLAGPCIVDGLHYTFYSCGVDLDTLRLRFIFELKNLRQGEYRDCEVVFELRDWLKRLQEGEVTYLMEVPSTKQRA